MENLGLGSYKKVKSRKINSQLNAHMLREKSVIGINRHRPMAARTTEGDDEVS